MQLIINEINIRPRFLKKISHDDQEDHGGIFVSDYFFTILCLLGRQYLISPQSSLTASNLFHQVRYIGSPEKISDSFHRYDRYKGKIFEVLKDDKGVYFYRFPQNINNIGANLNLLNDWIKILSRRLTKNAPTIPSRLLIKIEEIQQLLTIGHFSEAAKKLSPDLLSHIERQVSGTIRKKLQSRFHQHRAKMFENRLLLKEADYEYKKSERYAQEGKDILRFAYAAGNHGGTLRMLGIDGVKCAENYWRETLRKVEYSSKSLGGEYHELTRWLNTSLASTLTMAGQYQQALDATSEALEHAEFSPNSSVGEMETRLRRSRIYILTGEFNKAEDEFALVKANAGRNENVHWITGWIPRYQADFYMARGSRGDTDKALQSLKQVWDLNNGYIFQRIRVIQRLFNLSHRLKSPSILQRTQLDGFSRLHKFLCGVPLNQCRDCKGDIIKSFRCIINSRWKGIPLEFWI